MFEFPAVNWLAVLAGTVVNMVIGFLWYGPLFGQTWMNWIGKSAHEIESDSSMYIFSTASALISAFVLALIVAAFGASTITGGAVLGALVWLGIGATATLVYSVFEGPPLNVWALHVGYQLVVFVIMGALFAVW